MINIPDDRASSNCIRIEGNKDGVSMAKEVSYSKIDKKIYHSWVPLGMSLVCQY